MRRYTTLLVLALAIGGAACAAKSSTGSGRTTTRRADPSIMDTTQLRSGNFSSVYDAISALHSDWLLPRGGPANGQMPAVGVWVEGQMRSRGVEYLKALRPIDVVKVRRLSITESTTSYSWPWGGLVVTTRY